MAVGIDGASPIRQVGDFVDAGHDSPMVTNPNFLAYRREGAPLHPDRLLVGSHSNFGAPLGREGDLEGSMLSIEATLDEVLVVPDDFAADGRQSSALDGAVQRYTGQSPDFLNFIYHPSALTADYTAVGLPLSISINNAFGRPWFSSATSGASGIGTVTVVDPDGRPFAAEISPAAGGVFAGDITNRPGQLIEGGLDPATVANAFMGVSPDQSIRAVFAAVAADGSVAQVHVELGVDGLTGPDTVASIEDDLAAWLDDPEHPGPPRVGLLFNWVPDKILYISDPNRNQIQVLRLSDDGVLFVVESIDTITSDLFDVPVDLAPAVPEIISPDFASGTTLAGGSDLYVANRGNGTVVRITQDGDVVEVLEVALPGMPALGPGQINGIATSSDASKIWLSVNGTHPDHPDHEGFVVQLDAFGAQDLGSP